MSFNTKLKILFRKGKEEGGVWTPIKAFLNTVQLESYWKGIPRRHFSGNGNNHNSCQHCGTSHRSLRMSSCWVSLCSFIPWFSHSASAQVMFSVDLGKMGQGWKVHPSQTEWTAHDCSEQKETEKENTTCYHPFTQPQHPLSVPSMFPEAKHDSHEQWLIGQRQ